MEANELITKAKECILKGAKKIDVELPKFEVDLTWNPNRLILSIEDEDFSTCLASSFEWSESTEKNAFWENIFDKLIDIR